MVPRLVSLVIVSNCSLALLTAWSQLLPVWRHVLTTHTQQYLRDISTVAIMKDYNLTSMCGPQHSVKEFFNVRTDSHSDMLDSISNLYGFQFLWSSQTFYRILKRFTSDIAHCWLWLNQPTLRESEKLDDSRRYPAFRRYISLIILSIQQNHSGQH